MDMLSKINPVVNSSVIMKKEIAFWEDRFGLEDYDLWFRCLLNNKKIYTIPQPFIYHRVYNSSAFNNSGIQNNNGLLNYYKKELYDVTVVSAYYPMKSKHSIEDYRKWEGVLFIVLLIDPNRLSSYLDCPLYDNLSFSLKNYPRDYDTLNYFIVSKCLTYEEQNEILDRMDEKIKTTYNIAIPDVFVKNYVSVSSKITRGKTFKETLIISGFNVV
jgi:hypothetical protein